MPPSGVPMAVLNSVVPGTPDWHTGPACRVAQRSVRPSEAPVLSKYPSYPTWPVRTLPTRVRPAPGETYVSYVARLSAANGLHSAIAHAVLGEMIPHRGVESSQVGSDTRDRLATLSGIPAPRLALALPCLTDDALHPLWNRGVVSPQAGSSYTGWRACPLCATRTGGARPDTYHRAPPLYCRHHHRLAGTAVVPRGGARFARAQRDLDAVWPRHDHDERHLAWTMAQRLVEGWQSETASGGWVTIPRPTLVERRWRDVPDTVRDDPSDQIDPPLRRFPDLVLVLTAVLRSSTMTRPPSQRRDPETWLGILADIHAGYARLTGRPETAPSITAEEIPRYLRDVGGPRGRFLAQVASLGRARGLVH